MSFIFYLEGILTLTLIFDQLLSEKNLNFNQCDLEQKGKIDG